MWFELALYEYSCLSVSYFYIPETKIYTPLNYASYILTSIKNASSKYCDIFKINQATWRFRSIVYFVVKYPLQSVEFYWNVFAFVTWTCYLHVKRLRRNPSVLFYEFNAFDDSIDIFDSGLAKLKKKCCLCSENWKMVISGLQFNTF